MAIFRDTSKHSFLQNLFTDYLSSDVMVWSLKCKRGDELTLHHLIQKFILKEHISDLMPPLICPITDDLNAWRMIRLFASTGGNLTYLTQSVDNAIKQSYAKVHNSIDNPTTQRDDIVVIHVMVLLFDIGIRIWHNTSLNGDTLEVQAYDYIQRCQQQNFGANTEVRFYPIINLLFIPAGSYWQGQLCTISKWGVLMEYNRFYTILPQLNEYSIDCPNTLYVESVSLLNNNVIPTAVLDDLDEHDIFVTVNKRYHNTYRAIQLYFNLNDVAQSLQHEWKVKHDQLFHRAHEALRRLYDTYEYRKRKWRKYEDLVSKFNEQMNEYTALTSNEKRNSRTRKPVRPNQPNFNKPTEKDYQYRQFDIIQELIQGIHLTRETPEGHRTTIDLTGILNASPPPSESEDIA